MQVKRSLLKAVSAFLVFLAAINAAYGSQPPAKEAENNQISNHATISSLERIEKVNMHQSKEVRAEKAGILKLNKVSQDSRENKLNDKAAASKVQKPSSKKASVKKQPEIVASKSSRQALTKKSTAVPSSAKTLTREQKIAVEQKKAEKILAAYIAKYPILKGVKIYIKDCPNNWQGCAYYTKGIILIDPDHTAPLEKIIAHEIKHILDWRTDRDIDYNDYHK